MPLKIVPLPSLERLNEVLAYNPESGSLTWKPRLSGAEERELKRWNARHSGREAGSRQSDRGQRQLGLDGRNYLVHRLVWFMMTGQDPSDQIDHVNGDSGDNRWTNLRLASHGENMQNRSKLSSNTSGHKGVSWKSDSNKWVARITYSGRTHHIGYFENILDAAEAYRLESHRVHGNFARE